MLAEQNVTIPECLEGITDVEGLRDWLRYNSASDEDRTAATHFLWGRSTVDQYDTFTPAEVRHLRTTGLDGALHLGRELYQDMVSKHGWAWPFVLWAEARDEAMGPLRIMCSEMQHIDTELRATHGYAIEVYRAQDAHTEGHENNMKRHNRDGTPLMTLQKVIADSKLHEIDELRRHSETLQNRYDYLKQDYWNAYNSVQHWDKAARPGTDLYTALENSIDSPTPSELMEHEHQSVINEGIQSLSNILPMCSKLGGMWMVGNKAFRSALKKQADQAARKDSLYADMYYVQALKRQRTACEREASSDMQSPSVLI